MKSIDIASLPSDPKTSQKIIDKTFEQDKRNQELGLLGKFFGASDFVKINVAGLSILVLFLAGILYTGCILFVTLDTNSKAIGIVEFWAIITPIITLALGFMFGKSDTKM